MCVCVCVCARVQRAKEEEASVSAAKVEPLDAALGRDFGAQTVLGGTLELSPGRDLGAQSWDCTPLS